MNRSIGMSLLGAAMLAAGCVSRVAERPPVAPVSPGRPVVAPQAADLRVIVWSTDETYSLEAFEKAAIRAKAAGATHMVINDNLPRALWEYTAAGVLAQRSAILARHGLRGLFQANEPQVLPEAVFRDHPLWRGPRVDQENRSRQPHFAPCVDEPEVLALYRESIGLMLARCPTIDMFRLVTTDAGSGFCWSPGLYPGANGPERDKNRPMEQRVRGFIDALQSGAQAAGDALIEVRIVPIEPEEWMIPTFADPAAISRGMPPGAAIGNFESPNAAPYMASVGPGNPATTCFYPIRGIPNPADALAGLRAAFSGRAPRLTFNAPRGNDDLYARLLELVRAAPPATAVAEAELLHKLASEQVGEAHAEELVQAWQALARANDFGNQLKFAYPTVFGGVHQRWLVRPFVPFPAELTPAEKASWRPFLLSAKSEAQADNLVDMQAMHLFEGWSGRMWVLNVFNRVEPEIRRARARVQGLAQAVPERRAEFQLLDRKLEAYLLLCANARNAVNYQAALDYIKSRHVPVDPDPPLGALESWDRKMLIEIARSEIDNSALLLKLLDDAGDSLIDHAGVAQEEDVTLLGPNLRAQLKVKIDTMNAHWQDYNRLTTAPNP